MKEKTKYIDKNRVTGRITAVKDVIHNYRIYSMNAFFNNNGEINNLLTVPNFPDGRHNLSVSYNFKGRYAISNEYQLYRISTIIKKQRHPVHKDLLKITIKTIVVDKYNKIHEEFLYTSATDERGYEITI